MKDEGADMSRVQSHLALCVSLALVVTVPVMAASKYYRDGGQTAKPAAAGAERYTGTWQGQFKGKTFVILKLKMEGQKLVGTIGFSQISIDKEGEIEKVSGEVSAQTPIYDVKPTGDTLLFKHKDDDDVDEIEMKLRNDKEAELRFVNVPPATEGLKAPKPLTLKKEAQK